MGTEAHERKQQDGSSFRIIDFVGAMKCDTISGALILRDRLCGLAQMIFMYALSQNITVIEAVCYH